MLLYLLSLKLKLSCILIITYTLHVHQSVLLQSDIAIKNYICNHGWLIKFFFNYFCMTITSLSVAVNFTYLG